MKRLINVSNRLPVTFTRRSGKLEMQRSMGGVATGVSSVHAQYESVWLGWPGIINERLSKDERADISRKLEAERCHPVFIPQRDFDNYYTGFSNRTIWPLYHYFTEFAEYRQSYFNSYARVNEIFRDRLLEIAQPDDVVWIHDYQLMLLPALIRNALPDISIGYFHHIPFPSYETYRLLPWREQILAGLLGADLLGFHTYDYLLHFLSSVNRFLGYEHTLGQIHAGARQIKADVFPMGIDFERFASAADNPEVQREMAKVRQRMGDRKIVMSVDRLDYSKGIAQRLEAFDLFLEENPSYRDKVVLILVVVPSRTSVGLYRQLKSEVEELVGKINGKYGSLSSIPVWYMYRSLGFESLTALYCASDIALITPMRDGMNLIAKEFIAAKRDGKGVLILSEMAGAAHELSESFIINPNNKEEIARVLREAIETPVETQIERNRITRERLRRYDVTKWATDFLGALQSTVELVGARKMKELSENVFAEVRRDYERANRRLLLLDYDGTLTEFAGRPQDAVPEATTVALLERLCSDPRNEVVIISGRDRHTLERWFGRIPIAMVSEHGSIVRDKGGKWQNLAPAGTDWKGSIRPIMELYTDRTPGTFVENKEFSLVWHYRRADQRLASFRCTELRRVLEELTSKLDLEVMEGQKIVEVRHRGIDKGTAARRWVGQGRWDFVLAIGDDATDEDTFASLPQSAYSIKVGLQPTRARYQLKTVSEVLELLGALADIGGDSESERKARISRA